MSVLLSVTGIAKQFGSEPLFENLTMAIHEGQRIGVTGPNGSGKSTLCKILAGLETPDKGSRAIRKQVTAAYVPQDSFFPAGATVRDVLTTAARTSAHDDAEVVLRTETEASRAGLPDLDAEAASLSGGARKRLAIAEAMACNPQVVLLDEPTNHLDMEGIWWLERTLREADFACFFVSHDRYFLEQVATQMMELHRRYPEGIFWAEGNYSQFLEKREEYWEAREKYQSGLASKVRREVEWLRQGAKARTTKSKARIDEANRLISELKDMQDKGREGSTGIALDSSGRQTKRLIVAENLSHRFGEKLLFSGVDLALTAGMRLGLVGSNGSGKTTLLKLLSDQLQPQEGTIKRAEFLKMAVLDQNRRLPNENVTLKEALCERGDSVIYQDRPIHVVSWAKRFLFSAEQLIQPVRNLSGGERARVLLANLMLQPADVLFLDEPTNDLDIPTLEILEENLREFPGALVLVTHDRYLLDQVVNTVLALQGAGNTGMYAEYAQWEEERKRQMKEAGRPPKADVAKADANKPEPAKKKLSYKDQREWDQMEEKILAAEGNVEAAEAHTQKPEVMADGTLLQKAYQDLEAAQKAVEALYARWGELEAKLQ